MHSRLYKFLDSSKMAEMFNDFFKDISAKINDSIPYTKKSPLDYLTNRNDKSFFISPTTPEEVKAIIVSIIVGSPLAPTAQSLFNQSVMCYIASSLDSERNIVLIMHL